MGVLTILAQAGMYIAQERGYFAEEAINADFITFDTGAKAIPASPPARSTPQAVRSARGS